MTGMDLINIAKETIKFTKEYIKKNNSSISAAKVFGYEHLRDIEKDKYYKENMYGAYYKLDYDMPLCNHKECISDSHLLDLQKELPIKVFLLKRNLHNMAKQKLFV